MFWAVPVCMFVSGLPWFDFCIFLRESHGGEILDWVGVVG